MLRLPVGLPVNMQYKRSAIGKNTGIFRGRAEENKTSLLHFSPCSKKAVAQCCTTHQVKESSSPLSTQVVKKNKYQLTYRARESGQPAVMQDTADRQQMSVIYLPICSDVNENPFTDGCFSYLGSSLSCKSFPRIYWSWQQPQRQKADTSAIQIF